MNKLLRLADEEPVLVVLLAGFAAVFLTVFPPQLLVNDSFLTLTAGREVVEHGLPSRDELTVLGAGRTWIDQQWGAQVLAYGAHRVYGHATLTLLTALLVVAAFLLAAVGARRLGAGPRAIVLVFFPVILAAPWAWTIRAQVFALPLFTALVWLLATEARHPSRRVYFAIPILVVWANLHGSVALGALLTMLLAGIELVASRGRSLVRSATLLVLAPLAVLATPYGPVDTARYYRLMLLDPPFADRVTEWQPSDPDWDTLVFYVLAALALGVVVWGRRRLKLFDVCVLLLTFVGAVTAIRGIPWFALACMVLLPVAIGTRLEGAAAPVRRGVNRALAAGFLAVVGAAVVLSLARNGSWYERNWPTEALPAVEAAAAGPARVFATDRHADWLLWKLPALRGRIAYDVRFELYDTSFFDELLAYKGRTGNWKKLVDGYEVVVLDEKSGEEQTRAFLAEQGSESLYDDDVIAVVLRPEQRTAG
jgi:hypothetical protein